MQDRTELPSGYGENVFLYVRWCTERTQFEVETVHMANGRWNRPDAYS